MSTPKQIAANRRNAQKSTGPRTAAGKAKTRLNPLKHGLTAETIVLPFESPDDYRELQQSVLDDLQPQGITQQILVERFVQRHWVAQRLARTERAWLQGLYQVQLAEGLKHAKNPKANPEPYLGLAICMQDVPGDPHDLIHKNFFRYRAQIEQDFQRALRALERNRLLVSPSEQEPNEEIGSVPETAEEAIVAAAFPNPHRSPTPAAVTQPFDGSSSQAIPEATSSGLPIRPSAGSAVDAILLKPAHLTSEAEWQQMLPAQFTIPVIGESSACSRSVTRAASSALVGASSSAQRETTSPRM